MTKPTMNLDEILSAFVDIAKHGEGADRFRALKVLRELQQETGTSGLPDPMSDDEQYERMARLMKAMGANGTQISYRRAFPSSKRLISKAEPKVRLSDLNIDESTLPKTLKKLNRMFPEVKTNGVPKGYPTTKGLEAQAEFCKKKAIEIILNREQMKMNADLGTDATASE